MIIPGAQLAIAHALIAWHLEVIFWATCLRRLSTIA